MPIPKRPMRMLLLVSLCSGLTAFAPVFAQNDKPKAKQTDKAESGEDLKPRLVMWSEPTDIESRDLFYGAGGQEGAPNPSETFKFVRRITSGTSEKMEVTDSKNRSWTVKLGAETKAETAATRIVWAAGYHVDQDYFVKVAKIDGRGGFEVADVRFERRDDGFSKVEETPTWSWTANPFMGSRELQGLKVLMALLNNWDLKDENNEIARPSKKSGGDKNMHIYYVSDLGATFGATGSLFRKIPGFANAPAGSKGEPNDYARQAFITGVNHGQVVFNYKGKNRKALDGVSVENARWMGNLLSRLSDKQLNDAFRAAGFAPSEVEIYVRALRKRINDLKNLR
ncbi:MAG: hypothetical protein HY231_00325 [Acidobacteria bacterium]|nr:hypothetical protein [Acidobacteriota bacterium]